MSLIINVDGGSRGNPGPAGAGVVIRTESGERVFEAGYFLGTQTNNVAEYMALLRGLERVAKCDPAPVIIRSDSELMVKQMTGTYRVKNENLASLFHEAQLLLLKIATWQFRHVPREENSRADELANLAMDQRRDVVVFDAASRAEKKPDGIAPKAPAVVPAAADADTVTRPVRISRAKPGAANTCPAGYWLADPISVAEALPTGMCIHAAHAIVPTILAIQHTESAELSSVPTLTVRCPREGCGATFHVGPNRHTNGSGSSPRG